MLPKRVFLDDMFDSLMESEPKMKCDIYEKDGAYHLEMDVPGYNKEDIKIEYHKGNLIINAEKNEEAEDKDDKHYIRRERFYGKLSRSFYLGDLEEDNITAEFKDGTLKVVAPKKGEDNSKKYIDIN